MSILIVAIDLLILSLSISGLAVILTGGGEFDIAGNAISAHGAGAIIPILTALGVLRAIVLRRRKWPKLLRPVVKFRPVRRLRVLTRRPGDTLRQLTEHPLRLLVGILVVSFTFKFLNSVYSQGFFSGDDVESLTESLFRVQGLPFDSWDLRNSFFPRVFLEPLPRLAQMAGAGVTTMIISARLSVALVSLAAFPLCFALTESYRDKRAPLFLAGSLAASLLLLNGGETQFASSCLPRSVVSVFALATAWCVQKNDRRFEAIATIALGIAAAIRFSEVVLLPAAFCVLLTQRRYLAAVMIPLSASLVAITIWSAFDLFDGRAAMASLRAIVDYTLVHGESSRGYQPWYYYASQFTTWLGLPVVLFAALSLRRRYLDLWIWLVVPLLLLSFLPHKEGRYLVPYTGFAIVLAALGLTRWLDWLRSRPRRPLRVPRWRSAELLSVLLLVTVLDGLDGQRFRRSDGAVLAARHIRELDRGGDCLVQQSWKAGGPLYLDRMGRVDSLDPSALRRGELSELRQNLQSRDYSFVVIQSQVAEQDAVRQELESRGFRRLEGNWEHDSDPHRLFVAPDRSGAVD